VALRNKKAPKLAKALAEHVFLRYRLAHAHALGKESDYELLAVLTKLLGITKLCKSGYRPQANAICKVWYRCLNNILPDV